MKAVILAVLLAGCASRTVIETVEVKVPVMVPCAVVFPPEPVWESSRLTRESDIFTIVKSLWAEREQRIGYEIVLKASAAGCTQQPENAK